MIYAPPELAMHRAAALERLRSSDGAGAPSPPGQALSLAARSGRPAPTPGVAVVVEAVGAGDLALNAMDCEVHLR